MAPNPIALPRQGKNGVGGGTGGVGGGAVVEEDRRVAPAFYVVAAQGSKLPN